MIITTFLTEKHTQSHRCKLAIDIAGRNRGELKVYSEVTKGAASKLSFSVHTDKSGTLPAIDEKPSQQQKITVLVIDDEEAVREAVVDILEIAGFDVITAAGGAEGIELYKRHYSDVQLVLLDLSMPDIHGAVVFQKLCEICTDVRVLISSGYDEHETSLDFTNAGLAGFIQKPYSATALLKAIKHNTNS